MAEKKDSNRGESNCKPTIWIQSLVEAFRSCLQTNKCVHILKSGKQIMENPIEEVVTGLSYQVPFSELPKDGLKDYISISNCKNVMDCGDGTFPQEVITRNREAASNYFDSPRKDENKKLGSQLEVSAHNRETTLFKQMETGDPSGPKIMAKYRDQEELQTSSLASDQKGYNQPHPLEEEMQEYEDGQYEYEYDDLILDAPLDDININMTTDIGRPIILSEDPPFSEKDLEEFINNNDKDEIEELSKSEGTFHSLQNSINSSSSFVYGMGRIRMYQDEKSNSNSSKRKGTEAVDDTASSETKKGKKPKI